MLIFYKHDDEDKIWWAREVGRVGKKLFSFDKEKLYNFWTDYPDKLSKQEKELFDKENPEWADYKMKKR